jgi:hypothetical protein
MMRAGRSAHTTDIENMLARVIVVVQVQGEAASTNQKHFAILFWVFGVEDEGRQVWTPNLQHGVIINYLRSYAAFRLKNDNRLVTITS